jgi:uncharacterized protein
MKKLIILLALTWFILPVLAAAQAQTQDPGSELLAAAAAGNVTRVKQLLDAGANIEATNQMGATPLMWAALNGRSEVVAMLLERGANINARTKSGVTALSAAATKGHANVVKVLLHKKVDVNSKDDKGRTALDIARAGGFAQIADMLQAGGGQASMAEVQKPAEKAGASVASAPPTRGGREREAPVGVVTGVDLPENCLRIRSGPGVNYPKIGCANQGENLQLTGSVQNGWAQVQEPVQGWVSGGQIRAEGLLPTARTTSGYSGPRSQEYESWSDTDAALDRAARNADRDIRRLRSEYPDFGGPYYGPRGGGIIVGPGGFGIGIGIGR